MSLDFQARISRPLRLSDLVAGATRVAAELLGVVDVPTPRLVIGRTWEWGRVADPGRPVGPDDLRATLVGPGVPDAGLEVVDDDGDGLVVIMPTAAGGGGLVLSPVRQPGPVVTALALALAAALDGGGRFVDDDLQLAISAGIEVGDPAAFIAATRLPPRDGTVADATASYLSQFEHLAAWHLI